MDTPASIASRLAPLAKLDQQSIDDAAKGVLIYAGKTITANAIRQVREQPNYRRQVLLDARRGARTNDAEAGTDAATTGLAMFESILIRHDRSFTNPTTPGPAAPGSPRP